jgi:hypothetical protein
LGDPYRYVNTNGKELDAGKAIAVLSVSKTF